MFFYLFDVHGLWFVVSESSVDLQQKIEQNETRFRKQNKKRVTKNVILKTKKRVTKNVILELIKGI